MAKLFKVGQKVNWKEEALLLKTFYGECPFEIVGIESAKKENDPGDIGNICDCGDCNYKTLSHPQIIVLEIKGKRVKFSGAHFVLAE